MGEAVQAMMDAAEGSRKGFERKWYDNSFFDDGYHFRYVSRTQNKIIDLTKESGFYAAIRAIPKASRQIRGMINLLVSNDYVPVVYPDKVDKSKYPDVPMPDQSGQVVMAPNPAYTEALQRSKDIAKKRGFWLEDMMSDENIDLKTKLAFMGLLAAKHSISYAHIYPEAEKEKICLSIKDAFDVYLLGNNLEIEECPFVIIGTPRNIAEIKADSRFDEAQRESLNPDNRFANSEIKQAYMNTRYGSGFGDIRSSSVIQKEAYIKEYLNEENFTRIKKQQNAMDIVADKNFGDPVIRQVFSAGNIWLRDEYIDLNGYPLVDLRFEYGPLYQVAAIERFIPANKTLDIIASRMERYFNSFPLGILAKRKGESYEVSNIAGGQEVTYKQTPPIFQTVPGLPPALFNFMGWIDSVIQEQGVSTTTLGKLPAGVKGYQAIESLKESEYANLIMPDRMLKRTIRMIAEKFLDIADKYFLKPQTVERLEKDEPAYFDVIGESAMQKREQVGVPVEGEVVPLSSKSKVKIEVQKGIAYTQEGKKAAAKEMGDYMIQLATAGLLPPEAVTKFIEVILEAYQFGPTSDIMTAFEDWQKQGMLNEAQMQKIMVAMAQVIKDSGIADPEDFIEKVKVGTAEALKDTGVIDNTDGVEERKVEQEMTLAKEKHEAEMEGKMVDAELKVAKSNQEMDLKEKKIEEELKLKEEMAAHKKAMDKKMMSMKKTDNIKTKK